MTKKVAIMKGDGIGPEIVDAMTGILKECNLQSEMVFVMQVQNNGKKMVAKMHHISQNQL